MTVCTRVIRSWTFEFRREEISHLTIWIIFSEFKIEKKKKTEMTHKARYLSARIVIFVDTVAKARHFPFPATFQTLWWGLWQTSHTSDIYKITLHNIITYTNDTKFRQGSKETLKILWQWVVFYTNHIYINPIFFPLMGISPSALVIGLKDQPTKYGSKDLSVFGSRRDKYQFP